MELKFFGGEEKSVNNEKKNYLQQGKVMKPKMLAKKKKKRWEIAEADGEHLLK